MSSKGFKYLIKSKSLRFMNGLKDKNHHVSSIIWNDKKVHYRSSTSDMTLIYEILLQSKYKSEYFFPKEINPKIIFDIGGNIGITAIYLAKLFPNAIFVLVTPTIYNENPEFQNNFSLKLENYCQNNNINLIAQPPITDFKPIWRNETHLNLKGRELRTYNLHENLEKKNFYSKL